MTREDLVLHTEQMRAHLSQGNPPEPDVPPAPKARSTRRSRTASLTNLAAKVRTPSPPRTPVKSEPVDVSIPTRQMDTMQMVMERRRKQTKRDRKGAYHRRYPAFGRAQFSCPSHDLDSVSHSRDSRRVSTPQTTTPTRASTPQASPNASKSGLGSLIVILYFSLALIHPITTNITVTVLLAKRRPHSFL